MDQDTIFALSSGRPPAAIAIIRISGPQAFYAGEALVGGLPELRSAAVRQLKHPQRGDVLDEALVLRFAGPATATGDDLVELHCHGGRAVVEAVLQAIASLGGLRAAQPGEFTRRAFENGRIDLTEAEGLADLLEAETEAQRKAALALTEGGLRKQIDLWRGEVVALSAQAELAIDYVGEEEDGAAADLQAGCKAVATELRSWLARPPVERLRDGVKVVLAGPPNAGKSSLINVIAGEERAIVTAVPGTTRDYIEVPLALGGIPILLTDTAGLRAGENEVEAIGIARARHLVEAADILLWLGEPEESPAHPRLILVHSKADLTERSAQPLGSFAVSSVTGEGVTKLLEQVSGLARSVLPAEGAIALNRRQSAHVAEAATALTEAAGSPDPVLAAEHLRQARNAFDRLTGRAGVEDVLDALFGRFCLGK